MKTKRIPANFGLSPFALRATGDKSEFAGVPTASKKCPPPPKNKNLMSPHAQSMMMACAHACRFRDFFDRHIVAFNIASLALLIAACLAYVVQVNGSVRLGYDMRELENRFETYMLRNEALEAQARNARSLERVSQAVKILGFVQAETPQFINANAPSLAMAE